MAEHEDVYLVPRGQPLDEPQDRRDHAFPAAAIDAARHHQRNPHQSQSSSQLDLPFARRRLVTKSW